MELQPVDFFVRDLEGLLDEARERLARFLGARPDDLVFVPNATSGVNTVLRSLELKRGDELLVTDHEYNACRNALEFVAARRSCKIVVAKLPFPLFSQETVVERILARVTRKTRLALLDHVTSQTALVLPIAQLVRELDRRSVDVLVDGAHAPGMVGVNLDRLGAAYYTGNCHKWMSAPKGAGFLHVRRDRQRKIRPLVISHGANSARRDRSRFLIESAWTGTWDPSAWLAVPEAIRFVGSLSPRGWRAIRERNHRLVLAGRIALCEALNIQLPCPDSMIGSIASVQLPKETSSAPPKSPLYLDPLQEVLRGEYRIEVPVIPWPKPPHRLVRISAQLYNSLPQYEMLAKALPKALGR